MKLTTSFASFLIVISTVFSLIDAVDSRRSFSPQSINLWRLEKREKVPADSRKAPHIVLQDTGHDDFPSAATVSSRVPQFPEQHFTQPIDHHDHTLGTFSQRYWVNARHYDPGSGGPVIVLDGGETSGEDRLPFLDTGIVEILANATGGVGVVLEHRYYGLLPSETSRTSN